jgi:hypothetical protein
MSGAAEYAEPLVVVEEESPWERTARWLGPPVILACAFAAYANSLNTPFIFDGVNYLRDNPEIRSLWPLGELLSHVKSRPLGYLTFALNYAAAGNEVVSWHVTNLLIHVAGACALFGIARRALASHRLAARYGDAAARLGLAVAVVWVVHPLCTQSVTYLYQRLESLMGMFYLFTLYGFVRYAEWGRKRWAIFSLTSCLAACATKEVAVTAPLMVLWYDRVFLARSWGELIERRGLFHVLLWLTLLLPLYLINSIYAEYPNAGILDTTRMSPWMYARTQPEIVLHYLRLAVVPYGLNIDYAWQPTPDDWRLYGPWMAAIGVLLLLTAYAMWKSPPLGFVGGWWFIVLAPTSSVAPIIDLAFEHRTYLSLIAVVVLEVIAGYETIGLLVRRCGGDAETASVWRGSAAMIFVAVLSALTLYRNYDYRSELAMWRDVRFKVPHNPRGHYNYGVYLQTSGSAEEIEEAIREYKETLKLDPHYADAYLNLAALANWKAQYAEGEANYRNFLRYRPDDVGGLTGLAEALVRLERGEEAQPFVDRALEIAPDNADAKRILELIVAGTRPAGPAAPTPPADATETSPDETP